MNRFITLILLCAISFTSFAQSDSLKIKKIRELLELTGSAKIGVQITKQLVETYKEQYTKAENDFWDDFLAEVNAEGMINLIIPVYEKYFTEEDVDQMILFYKTPIGKKLLETLPLLTQDAMEAGKVWGEEIAEKILFRLKEKNYL